MKAVRCLGLLFLVSIASAQFAPYRRSYPSVLRLGDIDDNPYQLRGPFGTGLRRTSRLYNPLRLDDDNDWLRSRSLLRRSPLSRFDNDRDDWVVRSMRRGQLASRGLRRGLRRGLHMDDDNDNWYTSVMNRGRRIARGGLFGRMRGDDDDNWANSVMNRGRRLARGGLFGRFRDDDDSNGLWRSPLSRNRGAARRIFRNPWANYNDDDWNRPDRFGLGSRGLGGTSLSRRLGLGDDDNNYQNFFGRRALSNSLRGLGNVATPWRLDDDNNDFSRLGESRGITPLRNSFPALQNDDNDDDNGFSSLDSLRSSLGGPLAGRRIF